MNYETWYAFELDKLQDRIGYIFDDISFLRTALLHSSYLNEHGGREHNERMEFLGDSVLQLSVSCFLFISEKKLDEGALSRQRASLVCGASLGRWSEYICLPALLRTGKGVVRETFRSSMYADAVEAVFGAVFLDGGYEAADAVIRGYLEFLLRTTSQEPMDPKSSLQMLAQEKGLGIPSYEVLSVTGPSHEPLFSVRVLLGGASGGEGQGFSRKAAEFNAAKEALSYLSKETMKQ